MFFSVRFFFNKLIFIGYFDSSDAFLFYNSCTRCYSDFCSGSSNDTAVFTIGFGFLVSLLIVGSSFCNSDSLLVTVYFSRLN